MPHARNRPVVVAVVVDAVGAESVQVPDLGGREVQRLDLLLGLADAGIQALVERQRDVVGGMLGL